MSASYQTKTSGRPMSTAGKPKKPNKDIAGMTSFLMGGGAGASRRSGLGSPLGGRRGSGFSRASGDITGRDGGYQKGAINDAQSRKWADADKSGFEIPTRDNFANHRRIPKGDKKDKIIELERENNTLQEQQNFLDQEITLMETKLQRVQNLLNKRSRLGEDDDPDEYSAAQMQQSLKNETDDLRDQNRDIKEKLRKLKVVHRGLTQQTAQGPQARSGLQKNEKYAHVQGKLGVSHNKVTNRYISEAKDLRAQITLNQKKVMALDNELRTTQQNSRGHSGQGSADQLRLEILDMQKVVREIMADMDQLQAEEQTAATIFKESNNYMTELEAQKRDVKQQNQDLENKNMDLQRKMNYETEKEQQLQEIQDNCLNLERAIRDTTAEPFLRKADGNANIGTRMQDKMIRFKDQSKVANNLKQEQDQVLDELKEQTNILQQLEGEAKEVEANHKRIKDEYNDFATNRQGPNAQDALNGLIRMDAQRYGNLMRDLQMGEPKQGTAAPEWSKLPFMEKYEGETHTDPVRACKEEIDRKRQEKSDFAAELEKAQNLLHLQSDIQKENDIYYMHEEKRLALILKSVTAKVEEMSRRADDKARTFTDLDRRNQKTMLQESATGQVQDDDLRSEFSAMTQESEVQHDENILDFKVEDAEFYSDSIASLPNMNMTTADMEKQFITVVTCDFYNHSTETTQMSEGIRANYQTQFSFVNKVDEFYVNFLQKNSLKLDVYVSKNDAAMQVGRAEIILRELIDQEVVTQSLNSKTPVIQRWAKIYAVGGQDTNPLGVIKFKMRLRKPIQNIMRHFRETTQTNNMEKFAKMDTGSVTPQKKLIQITVVGAKDLKIPHANVANIESFLFYQFYTFDDHYSENRAGINPNYKDTQRYEVLFDAKAIKYMENQDLEIILFDDAAPIAGVPFNDAMAAENEDMIGVCKIPLSQLATSCQIHQIEPIHSIGTTHVVGHLEIKIDVMALEGDQPGQGIGEIYDQVFSREFERDIVMQIARKLAPLKCEIEMMFGVFSGGQKNCTKEDFKHTCLQRLKLQRDGMQERELDIFLKTNDYFRDSDVIEKHFWITVFEGAIASARNERLNQISLDQTLQRDPDSVYGAAQDEELIKVLETAIYGGAEFAIRDECTQRSTRGEISSFMLQKVLTREGCLHEQDALKVVQYLDDAQQVSLRKLFELISKVKTLLAQRSNTLTKILQAIYQNAAMVIERMEVQDYNKDGLLNIDGFQASLLNKEMHVSNIELREAFYLLCGSDQNVAYRTWILQRFPDLENHFSIRTTTTQRMPSQRTDGISGRGGSSHNIGVDDSIGKSIDPLDGSMINDKILRSTLNFNESSYMTAKQKIKEYMLNENMSLNMMFAIIDTNSDKSITFQEFCKKMEQLGIPLSQEEMNAIFSKLDKDNSKSIDYQELVSEFASINTEKIIKQLQKQMGSSLEFYFNKFALDHQASKMNISASSRSNRQLKEMTPLISTNELKKMLKDLIPQLKPIEVDYVLKHFDKGNTGSVTKKDFIQILSKDAHFEERKTHLLTIEDVVKPLATQIRKFNADIGDIFDRYDKDKNGTLSAQELRDGLKRLEINLSSSDVRMIQDYFRNQAEKTKGQRFIGSDEINKNDFIKLMGRTWERRCNDKNAQKSLSVVKQKFDQLRLLDVRKIQKAIQGMNDDNSEIINLVNFKNAINHWQCLDNHAISNLASFLDADNDGYISISEFIGKVMNARNPTDPMGQSSNSKRDPITHQQNQSMNMSHTMSNNTNSKWSHHGAR